MSAKLPAAIIEGTMASPSSPSVRFTEFEQPTMTKTEIARKNQPNGISTFLKNGTASVVDSGSRVRRMMTVPAITATKASATSLLRPDRPDDDGVGSVLYGSKKA